LESFGRTYLALGPGLILLLGTGLTILVALLRKDGARWLALLVGPPLSLAVAVGTTIFVARVLDPGEGSGFLLGAATLALYVMGLALYYPVIFVIYLLGRREAPSQGMAPPS
jgi:hypothetical protein